MRRLTTIGGLFSLALLAILIIWGPSLLFGLRMNLAPYQGGTYAVYLDSGHIFYGKLVALTGTTLVLKNVRSFQKYAVGEATTNTLQMQRDNPITKPEDFLAINRTHILFFEKVGSGAPILTQGAGQ